jgi:CRISPR/Cas system endoribonuclease Cas6 (RAMP superfamily)
MKRLDTSGRYNERCEKCGRLGLDKIHDCDFYTAKKRRKFYRLKPRRRETFRSLVMKEFKELKKLIDKE